jgi:hypothetical protein
VKEIKDGRAERAVETGRKKSEKMYQNTEVLSCS